MKNQISKEVSRPKRLCSDESKMTQLTRYRAQCPKEGALLTQYKAWPKNLFRSFAEEV